MKRLAVGLALAVAVTRCIGSQQAQLSPKGKKPCRISIVGKNVPSTVAPGSLRFSNVGKWALSDAAAHRRYENVRHPDDRLTTFAPR